MLSYLVDTAQQLWAEHVSAPKRVRLIESFMAYLVVCAGVQFAFCIVFGNYPFNAFVAGFGACVGQFVLLANLRQQIHPDNAKEFSTIAPKRAFTDFILGSLVLHFMSYHFIN